MAALIALAAWVGVDSSHSQAAALEASRAGAAALVTADAIATGPISPTQIISDAAKLDSTTTGTTTGTATGTANGATAGATGTTAGSGVTASNPGIASTVASDWLARVSASTGIPSRALAAYAGASLVLGAEDPGCNLGWTTLAGIGNIESGHASHGGAILRADGSTDTAIRGPALNGGAFKGIPDTDGGAWDGDAAWDRAVGPLQFIPGTWARWGADGNGDGVADPNQIDDAALAAGHYLCHSGDMSSVAGWRAAIFSYNHDDKYVNSVADSANRYATASKS